MTLSLQCKIAGSDLDGPACETKCVGKEVFGEYQCPRTLESMRDELYAKYSEFMTGMPLEMKGNEEQFVNVIYALTDENSFELMDDYMRRMKDLIIAERRRRRNAVVTPEDVRRAEAMRKDAPQTRRFLADELKISETQSLKCEICDQTPREHEWMDLDRNGFAVDCSNNQDVPR